jgi:hypothetical protein
MTLTFDQIRKFFEFHHPGQKIGTRNKAGVMCRFHEDYTPSCTLFLDGNGGFHCNGCGAKGNVFQFQARIDASTVAQAEAKVAEITGAKHSGPDHGGYLGPVVASYDYRGNSGQLIFQKRRYQPAGKAKSFVVYRLVNDRWEKGLAEDTPRVLYQQHAVVCANIVCVTEGEKDSDALTALNLYPENPAARVACTCSHGGAWKPSDSPKWLESYNPYFAGKLVLIFEDNDEPGRTYSAHVAASVAPFAEAVKVIRFADLPEKSDVSDYLATHTVADLRERIRSTLRWTPAEVVASKPMFQDAAAFACEEIAPVQWLVEGVVPAAGNGIVCGDPKASKSFHAVDLALSLATGTSWLGMRVAKRVRTALVSREDSPGLTQRRIRKLMLGRSEYLQAENWMLVNTRRHTADFKVMNPAHLDQLLRELKEFRVEFVVLDVFRSIHDSEENDNDQIPKVLEKVNRIQTECNCAVALVHHISKRDTENIFRGLRGASAIHGWMEWGIGISVANPDEQDKTLYVRKLEFESKEGVCSPVYSQIVSGDPSVVRIVRTDSPVAPKKQRPGIAGAARPSLQ